MTHDPRAAEQRARRLEERGKTRPALAVLAVALRRDPDDAGLWIACATIRHGRRQWREALNDAEHAMTLAPLPAAAQLVLADCYWWTGHRDLALTAYEHLLGAEGESAELYAGLYAGLVRAGRRDLALRCCRAAVETNPDDHAAWFAMAHCMVALDYDASYVASVLSRAVGLSPQRDAYRLSYAIQLTRCGRSEEAYEQVASVSETSLSGMTCGCSIARLLRACVAAGDHKRSTILADRLRRLRSDLADNRKG